MMTTYERGVSQGILQGERQLALALLEAKFGALSAGVKARVETLSAEDLRNAMLQYHKALSLIDLGLEG